MKEEVDQIIKKMMADIDPEKARMIDIHALMVYQSTIEKTMFQIHLRNLADLIHALSAIKSLAVGLEKTLHEGNYTPEEIQNMDTTLVRTKNNTYFGPKPFAEA